MKLTIGIKALNEERNIAACIETALAAARTVGGEVILADSGSVDRTVEIAKSYDIKIVQLSAKVPKSCGTGAQLAFQYACGEYFYILDGDMELNADFIRKAVEYLDKNHDVAAVGGIVVEMNTDNHEFEIRAQRAQVDKHLMPGVVDRLDCGGLYRVSAIRDVQYFADRNLHSFEEFDLGARLQARGWTLVRLDTEAVKHYGHRTEGYKLLWRRIRSKHSAGHGEVLKGALGRDHLGLVLSRLNHIWYGVVVVLWWLAIGLSLAIPEDVRTRVALIAILLAAPAVLLSLRRRSLRLGIYSLASWNASAYGLISGLLRRRIGPERPLDAVIIK